MDIRHRTRAQAQRVQKSTQSNAHVGSHAFEPGCTAVSSRDSCIAASVVYDIRVRTRPTERWAIAKSRDGTVWDNYEVSSFGNVRRRTAFRHWPEGKQLKTIEKSTGYLAVSLFRDRVAKMLTVHELVCSTFRGPPSEPHLVVRHINGRKKDNRLGNLNWGTYKENSADAIAHGQMPRGVKHGRPRAKHSLAQAAQIKGLFAIGARNFEIVQHYNLSPQAVCHIKKGRTGRDVDPISGHQARVLLKSIRAGRAQAGIHSTIP